MSFKLFLERKQRNPLRKAELDSSNILDYKDPKFLDNFREYYRKYPAAEMPEVEDRVIKNKYDNLLKSSKELAERYLENEIQARFANILRPSTREYRMIYTYQGVKVFVDDLNLDDINFKVGSPNYEEVKKNVLVMLVYIRDVLPNRRPKIVITNLSRNPHTKDAYDPENPPAGLQFSKMIYLDEAHFEHSTYWVHEYAHWVADIVPSQSEEMIRRAYKKMLGLYYKKTKRKNPKSDKPLSDDMVARIAKSLGFPEYGITSPNEFFAVLIENWKQLPNNKLTYKFKSLVKGILTRL
jgi:hypothetical protein